MLFGVLPDSNICITHINKNMATSNNNQNKLGKALWAVANELRGAMMADDFRDYMLSFLFWKYLSDNYLKAAKKELGSDYPSESQNNSDNTNVCTPLQLWYNDNIDDVFLFEQQMRRKIHYVIEPQYLWDNIVGMARTQDGDLLKTLQDGLSISRMNLLRALSKAYSPRLILAQRSLESHTLKEMLCFAKLSEPLQRNWQSYR